MTHTAEIEPTPYTGRSVASLGLAGWLGTMSPHTARGIEPEAVTPGVTTAWGWPTSPRCCRSTGTPPPRAFP